jgi:vitamin B12 transporter
MLLKIVPRRVDTTEGLGQIREWLGITTACVCAATGLLFATGSAAAEQRDSDPNVELQPDSDTKPTSLTTEPVVFEAVGPDALPEDPSSFTTVIEMKDYEGESKDIEEIIGNSVGVQVRRFGGTGDRSEISIRGSSSNQVVILLDGVRLNSAQSGAVDLSTVPIDLIERIEISRGGGSAQTGSGAIGGVVNIITKRAGGPPRTTAAFAGESFGTWTGSATQTGNALGTEFALGYTGFTTDGDWKFQALDREIRIGDGGFDLPGPDGSIERVNNDSESHAAQLRLGRDLGSWGHVSLIDNFFFRSAGQPGTDILGQSRRAHQRRTRNVSSLRLEAAELTPFELDGDFRVFHRFDRSRFTDKDPTLGAAIDSDNRNHSIGGRAGLSMGSTIGVVEQTFSLDGELRYDLLYADSQRDRDRRTLGLFIQDDISLFDEALRLIPALRIDDTEGFGTEWIPRLGVIIRPLAWLELKGNVERSYRVPNFDELYFNEGSIRGNPNLDPEKAFNADVGFEIRFEKLGPASDMWLEFAAFRNNIDDSIVFGVRPLGVVIAENTGRARAKGIELAGGFRIFDWVNVLANWTTLDAELRPSGRPLQGRADTEYLVRAEIGPADRMFRLVGEVAYRSSIPVSASGNSTLKSGSNTVYGLSLVVDVAQFPGMGALIPGRHLRLSASVANLTDESLRDAQFFPQPGRTLAFRAEWER